MSRLKLQYDIQCSK